MEVFAHIAVYTLFEMQLEQLRDVEAWLFRGRFWLFRPSATVPSHQRRIAVARYRARVTQALFSPGVHT